MRGGIIVTTAEDPCHRGGKEGGVHNERRDDSDHSRRPMSQGREGGRGAQ